MCEIHKRMLNNILLKSQWVKDTKREDRSQINSLISHLKELEKNKQPKTSKGNKIVKIRVEIMRGKMRKINKTKSGFLKMISKNNQPLVQEKKTTKVRNDHGKTSDFTEIQRITRLL